jgi:hypothetical protein
MSSEVPSVIGVFLGAASCVACFISAYFLGTHIARKLLARYAHSTEISLSSSATACGPISEQQLLPVVRKAGLAMHITTIVLVPPSLVVIFLSDTHPGIALGIAISLLVIVPTLLVVWYTVAKALRHIVCPHCKHQIPTTTVWLCPFENCGHRNDHGPFRAIEFASTKALLGAVCESCGQKPVGFICTACHQPFYFSEDKERQLLLACAYAVGYERFRQPPAEVPKDKKAITAVVEEIIETARDVVEATKQFEDFKQQIKGRMLPDDYGKFAETADDLFRNAKKSITGRRY